VKVWGYPLPPILFLLAAVFLLGNALVTDLGGSALALGVILTGFPAYWVWTRTRAGRAAGGEDAR